MCDESCGGRQLSRRAFLAETTMAAITAALTSACGDGVIGGTGITGPAFSMYHDHPGETTDVEVGYRTDRAIEPTGVARPGTLPGGRIARVVHQGAYDELPAAWDQLSIWMDDRGLGFGMPFWEVYLTEPTPEMDPAELRTEPNLPVGD